ncbi:cupin domain-containing protein [Nonomuraea sp. NBC_00507]|uniref:cupin domain-containing protein n=1 Tax=Nonomuraea sp. NBC_00507 TaxID=2976002 RepID=UPI002E18EF65
MANKISLTDVTPTRRFGCDIRALLTPNSVGSTSGFLGTMNLAPGEIVAAHYHPYSDEYWFVAEGRLSVRIDGEELRAAQGDALFVPRGKEHRIENTGDEPALVVFHIAPLAPSPELGHVDVEPMPFPAAPPPSVGG